MSPFLSLHYILYTLFPKSQHLIEKKSQLGVCFRKITVFLLKDIIYDKSAVRNARRLMF